MTECIDAQFGGMEDLQEHLETQIVPNTCLLFYKADGQPTHETSKYTFIEGIEGKIMTALAVGFGFKQQTARTWSGLGLRVQVAHPDTVLLDHMLLNKISWFS